MTRNMRLALYVYGGFAVASTAISFLASRTVPGQNKLVDMLVNLNAPLSRLNVLSYLLPTPTAAAPAPAPSGGANIFAPLPAPVVTQGPTGTSTYYGN